MSQSGRLLCSSFIVCVGQIGSHFMLHLHNNMFCVDMQIPNMQVSLVNIQHNRASGNISMMVGSSCLLSWCFHSHMLLSQ